MISQLVMTSARTERPSLAFDINESIREIHASLNRTILALLPLALPPYSEHANVYANGMSCILPIYEAIESSLCHVRAASQRKNNQRCTEAIATLLIAELSRGSRLKQDLTTILTLEQARGCETAKVANRWDDALPIHSSTQHPHLFALTSRIEDSAKASPHLLLAYTHVFYLAIFSGGRHIRARLRDVAKSHSNFFPASHSTGHRGAGSPDDLLTFWTFDPCTNDGEELKATFKRRFSDAEICLTPKEKDEVVSEARWAMRTLGGLIGDIARSLGQDPNLPVSRLGTPVSIDLIAPPAIAQEMGRLNPKALFHTGLPELILAIAAGLWGVYRYSLGAALLADQIHMD